MIKEKLPIHIANSAAILLLLVLQEKLPIYSAQSVYKGMMDQHENMQVSYLTLSLLHCCLNMVLLNNWQIFHHFFFLCHTYSILGITYRLQDFLFLFSR